MTPTEERAYINGMDYAIDTVKNGLTDVFNDPNGSPKFTGSKLAFLEVVREKIKTPPVPEISGGLKAEITRLKAELEKHTTLCQSLLQLNKSKKVRSMVWEVIGNGTPEPEFGGQDVE